jgi:predicted DNA-binding antitoxin AbrB/MazE fold protein
MSQNLKRMTAKVKRKVPLKRVKEQLQNYNSDSEDGYASNTSHNSDNSNGSNGSLPKETDQEPKKSKLSSVISKILTTKANQKRPVLSLKRKIEIDLDDKKLEEKAKKKISQDKKEHLEIGRVYPTNDTLPYEKSLKKIGTRGVVQLFNALRQAQKVDLEEGEKVTKDTFLKALKVKGIEKNEETRAEKIVPFLRKDFATEKATKHWDEEEEDED